MAFQKIIPMIQYHSFAMISDWMEFLFRYFFLCFPVITFRCSTEFPITVTYVLCLPWNRNSPHATINALQVKQYASNNMLYRCIPDYVFYLQTSDKTIYI